MQQVQFSKSKFSTVTSSSIVITAIQKIGFNPKRIIDPPDLIYETHVHPETKLLVGIKGSMNVIVDNINHLLEAGDELIIPGNTPHSGKVSFEGCSYYWSEKVIE